MQFEALSLASESAAAVAEVREQAADEHHQALAAEIETLKTEVTMLQEGRLTAGTTNTVTKHSH